MKAIFRADASLLIGTGHIMRCITLAKMLKENGFNIEFICRKHEGNLIEKIISSGFNVHVLEAIESTKLNNKLAHSDWLGASQQQDSNDCIGIIGTENTDWLIVDHYALDEQWHKKLKPYCKKLMVIDDLADRKFDCNIMLNQNLGVQKKDYKNIVPNDCELLLGCDYALLRSEFSKLRDMAIVKRENTQEIKNILISMGGSDSRNITYDILQNLNNNYNIVVALGKNSPHNIMLRNFAKNKKITIIIDADNMAELMLNADLAIGAGGSTSWERCSLGLPTLLYVTAENQKEIAKNLEKIGVVKIVKNLKKDLHDFTCDISFWRSISLDAISLCDGLGVNRVINLLNKLSRT